MNNIIQVSVKSTENNTQVTFPALKLAGHNVVIQNGNVVFLGSGLATIVVGDKKKKTIKKAVMSYYPKEIADCFEIKINR